MHPALATNESTWTTLLTYLVALPFFSALLWATGTVILARFGIGRNRRVAPHRVAFECACIWMLLCAWAVLNGGLSPPKAGRYAASPTSNGR